MESCRIYYCYKAINKVNGKVYIGFASDPQMRWREHKRDADKGKGYVFHTAIRKYGWDAFEFEVICCGKDKLAMLEYVEPTLIEQYQSIGQNGYNVLRRFTERTKNKKRASGGRPAGWHHSIETSRKISSSRKGIQFSEKTKHKMSEAARRRKKFTLSDEHKMKIGVSNGSKHAFLVVFPNGATETVTYLNDFCRKHFIKFSTAREAARKGYMTRTGYRFQKLDVVQSKMMKG